MSSYKILYDFCQTKDIKISRNDILPKALEITGFEKISTVKATLDTTITRGFYLSANNAEHPLVKQLGGGHIIVLARNLNYCWERLVYVKELMHLFDEESEVTKTPEEFERLLSEISLPSSPDRSPQTMSEYTCLWRALALLCPEKNRLEFKEQYKDGTIDDYAIALKLKIPQNYVRYLFQPAFEKKIKSIQE